MAGFKIQHSFWGLKGYLHTYMHTLDRIEDSTTDCPRAGATIWLRRMRSCFPKSLASCDVETGKKSGRMFRGVESVRPGCRAWDFVVWHWASA